MFDRIKRLIRILDGDVWRHCHAPTPGERLAAYERKLGELRAQEKADHEIKLAEQRAQEHIRREQQDKDRDAILATRVRPATKAIPFPDARKPKLRVVGK